MLTMYTCGAAKRYSQFNPVIAYTVSYFKIKKTKCSQIIQFKHISVVFTHLGIVLHHLPGGRHLIVCQQERTHKKEKVKQKKQNKRNNNNNKNQKKGRKMRDDVNHVHEK